MSDEDREPIDTAGDERARRFREAATSERVGIVAEFWDFLKHNKKWWLLPIIALFLLMSVLIVLGYWGLAPFIYPML